MFIAQLLHNSNYIFLGSIIRFVFLHVSSTYSMVDLKKRLLELCKGCIRVVQETLFSFKYSVIYIYIWMNDACSFIEPSREKR
jgi:uncharacterized membrane protein YfhO